MRVRESETVNCLPQTHSLIFIVRVCGNQTAENTLTHSERQTHARCLGVLDIISWIYDKTLQADITKSPSAGPLSAKEVQK